MRINAEKLRLKAHYQLGVLIITINVPVVYGTVCNGFEAGKNPNEGHWKGWALEMETFFGPEMATSEASAIWTQKSRDFQGPPLSMPQVMDLPASKPLR
jgi:hypothetical protein